MGKKELKDIINNESFSYLSSKTGYFPINNIGRWHTGITISLSSEDSIFSPISGEIIDYCFDLDKENYLLLEDKIIIPLKNNKTKELKCYSIFYNFSHHKKIEDFTRKGKSLKEIQSYNLDGILPIGIEAEITELQSSVEYIELCGKKYFLNSSFYMNLSKSEIRTGVDSIIDKHIPNKYHQENEKDGFLQNNINIGYYTIKKGTKIFYQNSKLIILGSSNIIYEELKKQKGYIQVCKDSKYRIGSCGNIDIRDLSDEDRFYYVAKNISDELSANYLNLDENDLNKVESVIQKITTDSYLISVGGNGVVIEYQRLSESSNEKKLVRFLRTVKQHILLKHEAKIFGLKDIKKHNLVAREINNNTFCLKDEKGNLQLTESIYFLEEELFEVMQRNFKYAKLNKKCTKFFILEVTKRQLEKNISALKVYNNDVGVEDSSFQNKTGVFLCTPYLLNLNGQCKYEFIIPDIEKKNIFITYKIDELDSKVTKKTSGFLIYEDSSMQIPKKFCECISDLDDKTILNFNTLLLDKNQTSLVCHVSEGYFSAMVDDIKIIAKDNTTSLKGKMIFPNNQIGFANKEQTTDNEKNFCVEWGTFFTEDISKIDAEKIYLKIPEGTVCKEQIRNFVDIGIPKDTVIKLSDNNIKSAKIDVCFYISGGGYDNSSGIIFNENKTKCKLNTKLEKIVLFTSNILLTEIKENDTEKLVIKSILDKEIDKPEYKYFIEKIILSRLINNEYGCKAVSDKTGRTYYSISFEINDSDIASAFNLETPLFINESEKTKIANKKESQCLVTRIFSGNIELQDAKFHLNHTDDNFVLSDKNVIELDNHSYQFSKSEIQPFVKNVLKEYFSGLIPINYGENKITNALSEENFSCELNELKKDLIKFEPKLKDCIDFGEENRGSNYLYADAETNDVYYYGSKYLDAVKYLCNTISLHPLEFEKNARDNFSSIGVCEISSDVDITSTIQNINDGKNKFYFIYPPKFYNVIEECKLKEMNPYKTVILSDLKNLTEEVIDFETDKEYNLSREIIDSPGFAPFDSTFFNKYFDKICGYAPVNTYFLEKMTYSSTPYSHEGIDFPGKWVVSTDKEKTHRTPIHSFINGTVVRLADHGDNNFGKHMIVSDGDKRLFLLGHLYDYADGIEVGSHVCPGQIVAFVGNTGNCAKAKDKAIGAGTHLHLTIFMFEDDFPNKVVKYEKKIIQDKVWDKIGTYKEKNNPSYSCYSNKSKKYKVVNPFDYSKERIYKG